MLLFSYSPYIEVRAASGNKIQDSAAGKGLVNLFNDASAFLLILSAIFGALCALYFFIRKNGADEQDQKKWNTRLMVTGICVVGAVLVTSTINLITGYFIE
jgi:heme/copper-type cytochrome/quinol oxidase subunit 3